MAQSGEHENGKESEIYQPRTNEFTQKFINDLTAEKQRIGSDFPLCLILIDEAIERAYSTGRIPGKEFYADVLKQKPLKIAQKVFLPVKQFPKFNFTGKILGPKGNSLRRLQEETQCKIAIKGRNSIRDSAKEEELRNSGDPKYAHFNKDTFLEISTVAPPAESYARLAYALAEVRKYIIPDKNDDVSQEQLRELMEINPETSKNYQGVKPHMYKSVLDRKVVPSNGAPKYLNLIKNVSSMEEDMYEEEPVYDEEMYEYNPMKPFMKRAPIPQYVKVRPNIPPYKRAQPIGYTTETKRPREAPMVASPYKAPPYAVIRKYK